MKKTKKEFAQEVKEELDHIKKNATPEEISQLNFDKFDSNNVFKCIYGQMTGYCDSERAKELMPKRYYGKSANVSSLKNDIVPFADQYFSELHINNTTYRWISSVDGYTPLEKYLFMVGPDIHKRIIKYLKSEIKKFKVVIP